MPRVFLGWDEPFLKPAVAWLLERRHQFPGMLILVPTTQSGRRLRESLAEAGGAILAPKVATPGSLLHPDDPKVAPDWIEQVAWTETLEEIDDWSPFEALFPEKPLETPGWAAGIADELATLRRSLQDNGLTLATASWPLKETAEGERWAALSQLEQVVEAKLGNWGFRSRSRMLASGLNLPAVSHIVLAGVTEMPPLLQRTLADWQGEISCLIAAPDSEAEHFSQFGSPAPHWGDVPLPWPGDFGGTVTVAADPRQQAAEALNAVRRSGLASADIALGAADNETGAELERTFTRAGWTAFHPAASVAGTSLARWFKVWKKWLADPQLAVFGDLLSFAETGPLVGGKRAQKAKFLSELRNRWMILRPEDLRRRLKEHEFRHEWQNEAAQELLAAIHSLETIAANLRRKEIPGGLKQLLERLARTGSTTREGAAQMAEWLDEAAPLIAKLDRSAGFWIDLMVAGIPSPSPTPPAGRVIDIQGWLELSYETGSHLVLCGMNEGSVPARGTGEPWLSDTIRNRLGLTKDSDRAARDAFLYRSMLEARRHGGRVDVICGKSGNGGSALLPSRLLLAAKSDVLPQRVKTLFREIEPPEAGMLWHSDWQWQPRAVPPPARISVTSLADYLACPSRYYLKHVLGMQAGEPQRQEWNARDFGTVAHEVVERWGRDPEARDFSKTEHLRQWFSRELDQVVAEWFGKRAPLAVRIQTEALRQRLSWLAKVQACERAAGWHVIDVERKIELPAGDSMIIAKMDRVDRNERDGQLRVIDYKTGKVDGVDKAHRRKITASTIIPQHLATDSAAIYAGEDKGKPVDFLWTNLQLPLYASALVARGEELPVPTYLTLGATEGDVAVHEWLSFSMADLEAARDCTDWIAAQIAAGVFWPPAERITYDDYRSLTFGKNLEDTVRPLPHGAAPPEPHPLS